MTHYEVIVIGAGVAGIYQIKRLADLGVDATVLEAGGDLGGTWYWNRYPGARFDSESYTYGYSFSRELLDEWHWKEQLLRPAREPALPQPRRRQVRPAQVHAVQLPGRCGALRRGREPVAAALSTTAASSPAASWSLTLGLLSIADPAAAARAWTRFKGRSFHTFHWPHEPVDMAGKRVAVIGTGATGIQVIGEIADKVGELTVFQRRPNWSARSTTAPISDEEMADIRRATTRSSPPAPARRAASSTSPTGAASTRCSREERLALWDKLYDEPGFGIWLANFREIFTDEEANAEFSEYIADSIRRRVKDPGSPRS